MTPNLLPRIVLIGRRNVGKSALFNAFLEQNKAIVSDVEGTTRDRTEGVFAWRGIRMVAVDTGGLDIGGSDHLDREVRRQAEHAISHANVILFVIDTQTGILPSERAIVKNLLFPYRKKVLLLGNKADGREKFESARGLRGRTLGIGELFPVSAASGIGIGDMLDEVIKLLPTTRTREQAIDLRVAIVGKPNVGKSSLLNTITGEERVIVSPVPHTTREPQDTLFTYQGKHFLLIDTAGIRRKSRTGPGIETAGIVRTLQAIEKADVVIFVVDASESIQTQDKHIAQTIQEKRVGVVIAANKMDLLPQGSPTLRGITFQLGFAQIISISALKKEGIHALLMATLTAHENRNRKIPDEELKPLIPLIRPKKGKEPFKLHIKRIFQDSFSPPGFAVVVGRKEKIPQPLLDRLEKILREKYDLTGTPITIGARHERD